MQNIREESVLLYNPVGKCLPKVINRDSRSAFMDVILVSVLAVINMVKVSSEDTWRSFI